MRSVLKGRLGRVAAVTAAAGVLTLGGSGVANAYSGQLHGPFATLGDCQYDLAYAIIFLDLDAAPGWNCVPAQGPGGAGAGYYWEEA